MKQILFLLSFIFIGLNNSAQTELWGICGGGSDSYSNIFSMNNSGNTFHSEFNDFYQNWAGGPEYTELTESDSSGVFYGLSNNSWVGGNLFQYNLNTNRIVNKITIGTPTAIGKNPFGSLLKANDGNFYGFTSFGGANSTGVLFQYDPTTNTYVKKVDLTVATGHSPWGSLIQAADGMLYGMTRAGGANGGGTLFKYDIATNVFTNLLDFSSATGSSPRGGTLLQASDGLLYGLTSSGGVNGKGVLFQYNPVTNIFTKKIDFDGTNKGSSPEGKLIQANDGNLYGMTWSGGVNNKGTLFQYNFNTNILTKKLDFAGTSNGANPVGSLMQASNGKLYGMLTSGGTYGLGVLFQYDYLSNIYTKRLDFDGANTGADPRGTIMQALDGKLYGLVKSGGTASGGVLFQYDINTNTYLKKIDLMGRPNGDTPAGSLIQATDQTIYGVNDRGVFQYDPLNKIFTKKAAFSTNTGGPPVGSLIQANDGKMYGTTYNNGPIGGGVLYQFDPSTNVITGKVSFDGTNKGSQPCGKLLQALDGKLYGMTKNGGINNKGVLFQYDPSTNIYTKKIDFNGSNGAYPEGGLIQASDGKIYGMTNEGGLFTFGVLFQYDISTNTLVKKIDFRGTLNGSYPNGDLVQASNGKLYGLTADGGINSAGVLFQYDLIADTLIKKYEFSSGNNDTPLSTLMQASDGYLYATANYGGAYNKGFVFRYNPVTEFFGTTFDFDGIISSATGNNTQFIEVNFRIETSILSSTMCAGSNILVPYKVVGTYDPGNVFTAQLSDEFGSFASPITIGTLTNISAGIINGIIPQNVTIGNAYRIRVISSSPVIIGSDNGSNITISASPIPTVTLNSGSICSGSNFTLTPGGATTYTYLNGGAIVNPTVSTTYSVIGTDGNGCSALATSSVTVNSKPTLTVNTGAICAGSSFSIIPNGAISYTYALGGPLITPSISTTFTVTGENTFGCVGSVTGSINVNPIPTVTANSGTICSGQSFTIAPSGANTYSFSGGSAVVSPLTTTDYTITGTSAYGCSNITISSVTVNPLPIVTANSGAICPNDNFTITPGGANTYSYSSGSAVVSATTNTNYTVTGTDANGCSNTAISSVTVNPLPTFTLSALSGTTTCTSLGVGFSVNTPYSVVWSGPGVINPATTVATVTITGAGIYTVAVFDGVCTNTGNVSVVTNTTSPVVNVNPMTPVFCEGGSTSIIANSTPSNNVSYLWDNAATTQSISVSPTVTTGYTVTVTDNTNGCYSSNSTGVTVFPLPSLTVTGTGSVCIGMSTVIGATSNAVSYYWSNGANTASTTVNPTVTTTYTFIATSSQGCTSTDTVSIIVDNTCADVWPGDANSDGLADNLDVLELGLHFAQTGASRASVSNAWQSYFANNWTGTITTGKNLNHSDCNGDGTIDANDTLAIYNNYGLTHAFKPAQTNTVNPQLSIVPDQPIVVKGMWGTASVYLGDATTPINNINGLAFTVDFDNTLIEPNNIYIEYQNSFIDASQNLYFRKLDFSNNKLFTASTHTVSNNVSGFGKIATLHYQILSGLVTDEVLNIGISQANQSDASGTISPLTSGTGTLMAIGASVGVKENLFSGNVLISPNPTNGLLNISFNAVPQNTKIEVYNSIGALALTETMTNKNNTINISELSSGMYFMKVLEGNRVVVVKKVVKE